MANLFFSRHSIYVMDILRTGVFPLRLPAALVAQAQPGAQRGALPPESWQVLGAPPSRSVQGPAAASTPEGQRERMKRPRVSVTAGLPSLLRATNKSPINLPPPRKGRASHVGINKLNTSKPLVRYSPQFAYKCQPTASCG